MLCGDSMECQRHTVNGCLSELCTETSDQRMSDGLCGYCVRQQYGGCSDWNGARNVRHTAPLAAASDSRVRPAGVGRGESDSSFHGSTDKVDGMMACLFGLCTMYVAWAVSKTKKDCV